ncbi:amino acid ABC transporter membrane protein, paat family [Halogeometricum borinquense DSM 11551]|uniref:amino acid ABC transporter membrane protein, PAAT family n=2 Tax=Halogeometricum borinquense TaxID=60847 RepID=E4NPB0_HALBP|nr:amino acid ABC transporter permease [Halogeometricum borinquense]ADQ66465.1 amino acid ABC transporter membrane protein, PAAT family [Halogeometricum borinquense DSM 11551]ELY31185.1 amino acid ABC transporter membrane protein, paat family [Halogeometricum borinquense DSM 11551]RYJ14332.1 amino acid ABC transporter permease [Halogeometricum borinquense]
MADSYSGASSETDASRDRNTVLNDETLKYLGASLSALFALGILGLVAYIIATQVSFELMQTVLPQFVDAYILVLKVVVLGSILSVSAGIFVGLARVSKTSLTSGIAQSYIQFFRGTPLLFQIFVIYFGIPALWPGTFPIQDWEFPTAIIALTLNHAAYVGEAVRGGINSVPEGQMEAARSLGMSYIQSMREVILPQAWRNALAAIGNDQVILVKDTSLMTVIALPELIQQFRDVNSAVFDPWTPLVIVAIAYLSITIPLGKLVDHLENRSDWGGDGH